METTRRELPTLRYGASATYGPNVGLVEGKVSAQSIASLASLWSRG